MLLTCDEQRGNDDMSDAVKQEIDVITNRKFDAADNSHRLSIFSAKLLLQ